MASIVSKTREAEDMCNYSEFLKQEAKEEEKLEMLKKKEATPKAAKAT